ncbi:MAG: gfo/Idh/MocA family oxidoreductase [Calditrichaeota bacterium]|nr:MAG: gfo/Idh/MocA family oxidoreductase [Calditrichota bacterium]
MSDLSRRKFLEVSTMAAAAGVVIAGCSKQSGKKIAHKNFLDQAVDGPVLKAGLIGCGGRGTGAAINFLSSGPNLQLVAMADVFDDRIASSRAKIKERMDVDVPLENCFVGFDAYKRVLESDVDVVILATPPHFRPVQFEAAIAAKKHVFMEKPVAVDPAGARTIIAASKRAESLGLTVGTGTQRRHQRDYQACYEQIAGGAIGEIVAANCYWNQSQLWYRNRKSGWTEMEYMIRDWVNWTWLSGDHIVEQHVHNIDVVQWFTGMLPTTAVGFGGRHRRVTGDQYDFFSIDFGYENSMRVHSMCRQIDGCTSNVSEFVQGTHGSSNCKNEIRDSKGNVIWKYKYPLDEDGKETDRVKVSPYVQEHIDLVTAIRTNKPYVEAEATANSTLVAIMGRISAYTGKKVTWEEMMSSDLHLGPKKYAMGAVNMKAVIPVPGEAKV